MMYKLTIDDIAKMTCMMQAKGLPMPLKRSTSKKAFRQNIAAEVRAGKPVKQAVAIAYSEKRAAGKGKKK